MYFSAHSLKVGAAAASEALSLFPGGPLCLNDIDAGTDLLTRGVAFNTRLLQRDVSQGA